jgi:flagellar hook protein FlgE
VEVSSISTQFSQGSFETTSNATDLAIDGDGFFMVEDKDGATYYTRAGNFHIDKEGYLVDSNNYKVQGYNTTVTATATQLTDITLANVSSEPRASSEITMGANLDASASSGETFNVSQNVFDSLGTLHNLSMTFLKTAGNGMWGFDASLDGTNMSNPAPMAANGVVFDENGDLSGMYKGRMNAAAETSVGGAIGTQTVNKPGQIYTGASVLLTKSGSPTVWNVAATDGGGNPIYENALGWQDGNNLYLDLDGLGGADITFGLTGNWLQNETISFDIARDDVPLQDVQLFFGDLGNGATIGTPQGTTNIMSWDTVGPTANKITGYASTSVVKSLNSDGFASGVLKSLDFEGNGKIFGVFTNGQTSQLGQVVLANFPDTTALKKVGNYFASTNESGAALRNNPESGGLGELLSNSLEISNTDTAKEFVNMITAQRAYQANARVITTANDMLTELMNIKR